MMVHDHIMLSSSIFLDDAIEYARGEKSVWLRSEIHFASIDRMCALVSTLSYRCVK
jgi:hypothetical protein